MPFAVSGPRLLNPQPQLRPVCLRVPPADPDVAIEAAGGLVTDPDDPRLAALSADRDLAALQVHVTAQRILRVVPDPGQL